MANAETYTKIIDIRIPYDRLVKAVVEVQSSLQELKNNLKQNEEQFKNGEITSKEYKRNMIELKTQIKLLTDEEKAYTKEIQNNIAQQTQAEGSVKQLKATLGQLTEQYNSLSKAQRDGAEGVKLKQSINDVTNQLKGAEQQIGIFNRDVGNYENAIKNAIGANSGFVGSMLNMSQAQGGVAGGFKSMSTAAVGLGKQLLALAVNPVVAILGIIAVVIMAVAKGIKSSEELTNRWNAVLAPFNRILDFFVSILQGAVGVILSVVEGGMKMLGFFMDMAEKLPFVGDAMKKVNDEMRESIALEEAKAKADKQQRDNEVANAKTENEVSKLRAKAMERDKYSAKERLAFIEEANSKEEEASSRNVALAKERLRIAEAEAARAGNPKETEEELSKLRVNVLKADTEYNNKTRELLEKRSSFMNEIATEDKERSEKAKNQKLTELKEYQSYEDLMLSMMEEGAVKQIKQLKITAGRQIQELKNRLVNEADLTIGAKKAINDQIVKLESKLSKEIQTVTDNSTKESLQKEIDRKAAEIQIRLGLVKKGSEKELALTLEQLKTQQDEEIKKAKDTGISISLINEKYRKLEQDAIDTVKASALNKERSEMEERIKRVFLLVGEEGEARSRAEEDAARKRLNWLLGLDAEEKKALGMSDLVYTNAVLQAQNDIQTSVKKTSDIMREAEMQQLQAAGAIFGAMSDLFNGFAEDNEALAAFAKTLALFEIGVNLAVGISKAVAESGGNLIKIATGVAAVTSAILSAKNVLTKSKQPKAPKFHSGGLVGGSGEVNATLLSGESVMTRGATQMFAPILSAMNLASGGNAISVGNLGEKSSSDLLKEAIKEAFKEMPAPVVSVVDITTSQKRVKTIEMI